MISWRTLLPGSGGEDQAILKQLRRLAKHKTPVQIEVEGRQVHFRAVLAIKQGMVVVARPRSMPGILRKGGAVRFADPEGRCADLRMVVLHPHFLLTTGGSVFLCRIPTEYAASQLRSAKRFDTVRFESAALAHPDGVSKFRLLDVSLTGCRVHVPRENARVLFPLGEPISGAMLVLGPLRVELAALEPKAYVGKAVGCAIHVARDDRASKVLEHLLSTLDKHEQKRFRTALNL